MSTVNDQFCFESRARQYTHASHYTFTHVSQLKMPNQGESILYKIITELNLTKPAFYMKSTLNLEYG